MTERVRLPKLVAEGIGNARELQFSNQDIIIKALESADHGQWRDAIRDYAADNFDLFIKALVNGYEVEITPEVIILEEYLSQLGNQDKWCVGFQEGIKFTLNVLDKKILGVNA